MSVHDFYIQMSRRLHARIFDPSEPGFIRDDQWIAMVQAGVERLKQEYRQ